MVKLIVKRNQEIVPFERDKIETAVFKALVVSNEERSRKELRNLSVSITDKVIFETTHQLEVGEHPSVEHIQDVVELTLMRMGEHETAKAYIKYRYKHLEQRENEQSAMNILSLFDDYIGQQDWQVRENSKMSYSLQGLNNHVVAKATKHFWLHNIYTDSVRESHEKGDFHVHDLGLLSTYCCGWSLEELLKRGFWGAPGKVESAPAKHFETALMQLVNFIYTLQGEAAGAQAVSNFDTLLAPFIRMDNLDYLKVKQVMQAFIFNMNVASRVGFQTPFFNLTMDKEVPTTHRNLPIIVGGQYHYDLTYGDFQKEMNMINLAFCDVMMEGDAKGRVFTFPIPTYNITREWDWENPVSEKIMEMTAKLGIPYFSNFVNSDLDLEDVRSMCCKLKSDNKVLIRRGGGLFGANPKTGSIGVVTINMARLGYTADSMENLLERLERLMEISKDSLEMKRKVLESNMKKGLYPYSKYYLEDIYDTSDEYFYNHFATIGPNGINECIMNFTNGTENIITQVGKQLAEEILDFMNEVLIRFQEETDHLYNLEASPAEEAAYRFAKLDQEIYPDIMVSGDKVPYYTNSTHLPFGHTEDLFDALDHQESLQIKYTGGTVFCGFLAEGVGSTEVLKKTLKKVVNNYKIPYFTLTPTASICLEHKSLPGEV